MDVAIAQFCNAVKTLGAAPYTSLQTRQKSRRRFQGQELLSALFGVNVQPLPWLNVVGYCVCNCECGALIVNEGLVMRMSKIVRSSRGPDCLGFRV